MKARKIGRTLGSVALAAAMTWTFGFAPLSEALAADTSQAASQSEALQEAIDASAKAVLEDQPSIEEMLEEGDYVKHEAIAMVQRDADDSQTTKRSERLLNGAEVLATVSAESVGLTGSDVDIVAVEDEDLSVKKVLTSLDADSRVLAVQPNYEVTLDDDDDPTGGNPSEDGDTNDSDDDASYGDYTFLQWAYTNSTAGVNSSTWNDHQTRYEGSVVAVLDSGIDYTNPDLKDAMFDMTPYIDKIEDFDSGKYGYNGINHTPDPMDDNGHGTHCAGIIASSDNGYGTTGLAAGAKVIGAKALSANGGGNTASFIRCFGYLIEAAEALDGKLKAINCSWGGNGMSNTHGALINELGSLGVVTVFASGNDGKDISKNPGSSAVYWDNPYVVTVDSSTINNKPSSFTNSSFLTDVYAPGSEILSTYPMNQQSYIPSLVDDNDAYHPFDNAGDSLPLYSTYKGEKNATATLSDAITTTFDSSQDAFSNKGSGSQSVKMSDLSVLQDDESKNLCGTDDGREFYTTLEFNGSDVPCYFQGYFRVDSEIETSGKVYLGIQVRNKKGKWSSTQWTRTKTSSPSGGDFGNAMLSTDEVAQAAVTDLHMDDPTNYSTNARTRFVTTTDGDLVLRCFSCGNSEEPFGDEHSLWIDDFALGNSTVPYSFASGTSMATPLVAATCIVLDDKMKDNSSYTYGGLGKGEQACYLAAAVKASATNKGEDSSFSNCLTEGRVDLAQMPSENEIQYWLNTENIRNIIKEHTKIWSSPKDTFEDASLDAGLWDVIDPGASPLCLDAVNNILYLATGVDNADSTNFELKLLACDLKSGQWKTCSSPDLEVYSVSSAAYQGKLLYSYSADTNDGPMEHGIVQYDPKTDSWSNISSALYEGDDAISGGVSLVNCNGTLLVAAGSDNIDEDSEHAKLAIYSFDPEGNKVTEVGTIDGSWQESFASVAGLTACTASGSTVYMNNVLHSSTDYEDNSFISFEFDGETISNQKVLDEPISKAGTVSKKFGQTSSYVATADGLAILGSYLCDDTDELIDTETFMLTKDSEKAEPFAKRLSDWYTTYIAACAYNGKLYAVGLNYIESNLIGGAGSSAFIRSTAVKTDSAPGDTADDPVDPTPTPDPVTPSDTAWVTTGKIKKGKTYTAGSGKTKASYKVVKPAQKRTTADGKTQKKTGTVIYTASKVGKKAKSATIPAKVKIKGGTYKVVKVAAKAFAKKKRVRTVTVKAGTLTKKSRVKKALKGSKVTKVKVRISKKATAKKVRKAFAKRSWVGKKVRVK